MQPCVNQAERHFCGQVFIALSKLPPTFFPRLKATVPVTTEKENWTPFNRFSPFCRRPGLLESDSHGLNKFKTTWDVILLVQ